MGQLSTALNGTPALLLAGNAQDTGKRQAQEDAFGYSALDDAAFISHGGRAAVLCDGMGGMRHGADAASTAVRAFQQAYALKTPDESPPEALERAVKFANYSVYQEAVRRSATGQMGCTLVAVVVRGIELYCIHAGDSRAYKWDGNQLGQLTVDHNYARVLNSFVAQREITQGEADQHPRRDELTSYLGRKDLPFVDVTTAPVRLTKGEWVLLCSDGLHGVLSSTEIGAELRGSPSQAARRLIERALERCMPEQDNVTVVVFRVEPDGSTQSGHWRSRQIENEDETPSRDMARQAISRWGVPGRWNRVNMMALSALTAAVMGVVVVGWPLIFRQDASGNAPHMPTLSGIKQVEVNATPVGVVEPAMPPISSKSTSFDFLGMFRTDASVREPIKGKTRDRKTEIVPLTKSISTVITDATASTSVAPATGAATMGASTTGVAAPASIGDAIGDALTTNVEAATAPAGSASTTGGGAVQTSVVPVNGAASAGAASSGANGPPLVPKPTMPKQ